MRRRDLLVCAALLAGVSPAAAQQPPIQARVGWLAHEDTLPRHFFDEALARLGWVEGKNLVIERRFGGIGGEQIASAAAELVAWHPDVIVALGTIDARPVLALTRAIPIVVLISADPVGQGLGASLARPGGNVTGTALGNSELVPKLLELARDLVPAAQSVSVLGDPRSAGTVEVPVSVGKALGQTIVSRHAGSVDELDAAFAAAAADGDGAIVVQHSPLTGGERWRVVGLAARFRLPAVYPLRDYVEAGGLLSYGPVLSDNFKRAAALVDKILRGASPGELPFEQPTRFELVVNLKTAKELGLTIPPSILARADEVIE
jgi:putative ABC transport system substrate-binding protein